MSVGISGVSEFNGKGNNFLKRPLIGSVVGPGQQSQEVGYILQRRGVVQGGKRKANLEASRASE